MPRKKNNSDAKPPENDLFPVPPPEPDIEIPGLTWDKCVTPANWGEEEEGEYRPTQNIYYGEYDGNIAFDMGFAVRWNDIQGSNISCQTRQRPLYEFLELATVFGWNILEGMGWRD